MIMDIHETVGMFDAKTHFSEIVDRVQREGRSVTVTRRGRPVVRICPIDDDAVTASQRAEALATLQEIRQRIPKSPTEEIIANIREGRR